MEGLCHGPPFLLLRLPISNCQLPIAEAFYLNLPTDKSAIGDWQLAM
jgi:hypothetical protein